MTQLTSTTALTPLADDGWDAAAKNADRGLLRGLLLLFRDGAFSDPNGLVPLGTQLLALATITAATRGRSPPRCT